MEKASKCSIKNSHRKTSMFWKTDSLFLGTKIALNLPLPKEADEPYFLLKIRSPRLYLRFNHLHYGLSIAFIGRINTF